MSNLKTKQFLNKILKYIKSRERLMINMSKSLKCLNCGGKSVYINIFKDISMANPNAPEQFILRHMYFIWDLFKSAGGIVDQKQINEYLGDNRIQVQILNLNIRSKKMIDYHIKLCSTYCAKCHKELRENVVISKNSPHIFHRKLR